MDNYQIAHIASIHKHCKNWYGGVFTPDTLPIEHKKYPVFYICNTALMKEEGKHWVAIIIPSRDSPLEYFDSLGKSAKQHNSLLEKYLIANSKGKYIQNSTPYQDNDSSTCAEFCLYFCDLRAQNIPFPTILQTFDRDNLTINELLVRSYVHNHMTRP